MRAPKARTTASAWIGEPGCATACGRATPTVARRPVSKSVVTTTARGGPVVSAAARVQASRSEARAVRLEATSRPRARSTTPRRARRPSVTRTGASAVQTSVAESGKWSAATAADTAAAPRPLARRWSIVPGAQCTQSDAAKVHAPSLAASVSQLESPSRQMVVVTRHSTRQSPSAAAKRAATSMTKAVYTRAEPSRVVADLPPACRKDGEERGRATRARDPSPFPAEGQSAGVRRAGFLARGSSSPGPFPPRRAVVVTGVVPPYSCGAAGALHPLPSPVDVGGACSARPSRGQARLRRHDHLDALGGDPG